LHLDYRTRTVEFLSRNREDYEPFIEYEDFDKYISRMGKEGTWAGHIELQALSLTLQMNLVIHKLTSNSMELINFPQNPAVHLSYHNGEHYNCVRPIGQEISGPISINYPILQWESDIRYLSLVYDFLSVATSIIKQEKLIVLKQKIFDDSLPSYLVSCIQTLNELAEEIKDTAKEMFPEEYRQKPDVLPDSLDRCWCGSNRLYRNCCEMLDKIKVDPEHISKSFNNIQIS
jgi:hypothetical protein